MRSTWPKTCNSNKCGIIACMGDKRVAYRSLMGRPDGKITLGRPSLIWKDNIKMYLQQIVWEGMNWIYVGQNREEPPSCIKCGEFLD